MRTTDLPQGAPRPPPRWRLRRRATRRRSSRACSRASTSRRSWRRRDPPRARRPLRRRLACPAGQHRRRRRAARRRRIRGARRPDVARFDGFHPQAVVRCRNADDVAAALGVARRTGLELAVRSGGHCFAGHSSSDGIVLDVGPLAGVALDGEIATLGAGTRLGAVYDALAPHGVTLPAGCGPRVAIAGLALGGGLGVLGRQHGVTSDSLVGARVVLADGRIVDCDAEREPDLFWALRGAGAAGFGVVTSLAFRTCLAPRSTTFHLVWPLRAAADVIGAWQEWAPDGPDELAASLVVTAARDAERPALASVFGALAGSEGDSSRCWTTSSRAPAAIPSGRAGRRRPTARPRPGWASGATGHGPEDADEGHAYSTSAYVGGRLPGCGRRRAGRGVRRQPGCGRGAGARLLAVGRRLRSRAGGRDRVRPPQRPLPAQADGDRRGDGDGRRARRRAALAGCLDGRGAAGGERPLLPELPRPRAAGSRRRVLRHERAPPADDQAALRPERLFRRGSAL